MKKFCHIRDKISNILFEESIDSQQRLLFRGYYNEKIAGVYGGRLDGGNVAIHVCGRSWGMGMLHLCKETSCGWVRPMRARLWTRCHNLLSSGARVLRRTAVAAPVSAPSTGKDNV